MKVFRIYASSKWHAHFPFPQICEDFHVVRRPFPYRALCLFFADSFAFS